MFCSGIVHHVDHQVLCSMQMDGTVEAILEICVDSVAGAKAAAQGGAQRIELCSNLFEGGVTPSYGLIKLCRTAFPAPGRLLVLIRPRGGDFVFSREELDVMRADIQACAQLGVDGVVIGCLTKDGQVDDLATSELMHLASSHNLDITFNRAFDMVPDQSAALQQLKTLGVRRVLTSGGSPSALAGAGAIARLVGEAGLTCTIVAGGGVTEDNVADLIARTGVREVHSSASRLVFSTITHSARKAGMTLCSSAPPRDYAWGCASLDSVQRINAAAVKAVASLPR